MGRPLNKRYFGTPTDAGNEIKVQFYDTVNTSSNNGWIVKQLGSKKFRVTDGTVVEDCYLVDKLTGDLAAGDMTITVKDDAGNAKQVIKIAGRKVTLDSGESIGWNFSDATDDAAVEMEEAGSETTSEILVATALVTNGIVYQIVTAGNTDFTTFGAADSNVGTIFTMAAQPGTGTGTVRIAPDDFEGDE